MLFQQMVKRLVIDALIFFSALINLYFLYSQMFPFVNAAIALGYVNGQTVSYSVYTVLLLCLPVILLLSSVKPSKKQVLRVLFYAFAATIFAGTVSDLISYNFFMDYTFKEGDTVFVNIMWNMPNLGGALFSLLISALYIQLGIWIKRRRTISYCIYLAIFLLSLIVPFSYTFLIAETLLRATWLQKSMFILLEQFFILIALTMCASSRSLWQKHIWSE